MMIDKIDTFQEQRQPKPLPRIDGDTAWNHLSAEQQYTINSDFAEANLDLFEDMLAEVGQDAQPLQGCSVTTTKLREYRREKALELYHQREVEIPGDDE